MSPKDAPAKDPLSRLVDTLLGGGGHRPVWGQHQPVTGRGRGFDERRFRKALRAYWGAEADPMRVSLAVQDAVFVAGVVQTVSEQLGLDPRDKRRIAAAVVRQITPVVIVAGVTVAAGTAALLTAKLAFLRDFGPGLAVAVVVAMLTAIVLVPAVLAVVGERLFWPHEPWRARRAEGARAMSGEPAGGAFGVGRNQRH